MKCLNSMVLLIATVGCMPQQQTASVIEASKDKTPTKQVTYEVLTERPDALLDKMTSLFSSDRSKWNSEFKSAYAMSSISGERTVELLEIACYADVECHSFENPLRVATLDYIKENLHSPDVRKSLQWIRTSYESSLPIEAPGDVEGLFKSVLVQAMKIRMTEYANDLLQSYESTENRK